MTGKRIRQIAGLVAVGYVLSFFGGHTPSVAADGGAGAAKEPASVFRETLGSDTISVIGETDQPLFLDKNVNANFLANVPSDGEYSLKITYAFPAAGTEEKRCEITINGEQKQAYLPTSFVVESESRFDTSGNQIRPQLQQEFREQTENLKNAQGELLVWKLTAGTYTIDLCTQTAVEISELSLEPYAPAVTYAERLAEWERAGYQPAGEPLYIEAEEAFRSSESAVSVLNDRSSALTTPTGYKEIRYNAVGSNWNQIGQWIEWTVTIGEAGLYTIGMRWRQAEKNNDVSFRRLTIDGEVPFREAEALEFSYRSGWQSSRLGASDRNAAGYFFYLPAGEHTLRLEAVEGPYAAIFEQTDACVSRLNRIYRQIIMVTGSSPDSNRDYQFYKRIPETLEEMKTAREELLQLQQRVRELTGQEDSECISLIDQINHELQEMYDDDLTIAYYLSSFESNISALSTWVLNAKQQPLEIDRLILGNGTETLPQAETGFWSTLVFLVDQFFYSFVMDYASVGQTEQTGETNVTVWLSSGRDQASVLSELTSSSFTPEQGIGVQVQLVSAGALLPATLAEMGPDVYLGMGQSEPMNYALRGAVQDLSPFAGCEEVLQAFHAGAVEPFRFDGALYALPETQTFPLLFYRTDILEELDISVQELNTWEDILQVVMPKLQESYLQFGFLPSIHNYGMLLYQNGGRFYNDEKTACTLNEMTSVQTFSWFTTLYTDYKLDISYDFANRFRTGEMPIAIADYTAYNQLSVYAPEIAGLWSVSMVPGVENGDGTYDRSVVGTVTGCVMLSQCDDPEAAWKFLKWWVSADTQSAYGLALENIMGTAARYSTANRQAMKQLPWNSEMSQTIQDQWQWVKALPELPGSYMTARYFDFAWRDVVNNNEDILETMYEAVADINAEIEKKRKEFGLTD